LIIAWFVSLSQRDRAFVVGIVNQQLKDRSRPRMTEESTR
jgi:hypothetical protein